MIPLFKLMPIAAMLALAGSPCLAQPSGYDADIQAKVVTIDQPGQGSTSSMWSMSSTEDGRTIKLEGRNGVISAQVDGMDVPADRIVREGTTVKIKDDKGEVIYQTEVPSSDTSVHGYTIKGRTPGTWWSTTTPRSSFSPFGGRSINGSAGAVLFDADPPKVMIGVQLLDPDSSLRGHLGLKENEATLVGAIYEGLPAAQAGIEPYDIIVAIDGKTPASPMDLRKALHAAELGKTVSMDVIHHGQKKTVTITPEKYDREKLDKSKINAIAAATGTPSASAIAGIDPNMLSGMGSNPFVVAIPPGGKPLTLSNPGLNGMNGWDSQAFTEQMREMAAQAKQQAEAARQQADEMRRQMEIQLHNQMGGGPAMPGMAPNMQQQLNEMMKRMDSMQKMLEQQREKPKTDDKSEGRS